ncbi:protein PRRC1 [Ornithorhynchus anatinus]|uniref:protein PRRC1 n=1 Tax=Ornithorhynchus anatinus TaxID=9258 RepID=UPI0019D49F59|nr:protein PRRC1 [Ornithorhynchus anatinus]
MVRTVPGSVPDARRGLPLRGPIPPWLPGSVPGAQEDGGGRGDGPPLTGRLPRRLPRPPGVPGPPPPGGPPTRGFTAGVYDITRGHAGRAPQTPLMPSFAAPPADAPGPAAITFPEAGDPPEGGGGGGGGGIWGFIKGVAGGPALRSALDRTRRSVETVITTLDPGMEPYIRLGGEPLELCVSCEDEETLGSVGAAFRRVFGRARVSGHRGPSGVAPQPVGYAAAHKGARERVAGLRRAGRIPEGQAAVGVQDFVAELLPDRWFDLVCLILDDPARGLRLETFTQATPLPLDAVRQAERLTPPDYGLRWSGLRVPVAPEASPPAADAAAGRRDWRRDLTGVSRHQLLFQAARALAGSYYRTLAAAAPPPTPGLTDAGVIIVVVLCVHPGAQSSARQGVSVERASR